MNEQFEKYAVPLKELNELNVKNTETFVEMQLKQSEESTKVNLDQLKAASQVTDADSLKSFLESQAEVSQQLNARVAENTRAVVEMGNIYAAEMQKIFTNAFAVK